MKIQCIIIEDEPPAQRILKRYISELSHLDLAGTFTNPLDALELLSFKQIDLIFLDIQLPTLDGLQFLTSLRKQPEIIITTAYPDYAVEGYELSVTDYLVKPISFERFLKAVSKIKKSANLEKLGNQKSLSPDFTFLKSDKTIYKINFKEINFIRSDKDYVEIITESDRYYILDTLKHWIEILPDRLFCRVHKSYIINLAKIKSIHGNRIQLQSNVIPIGRSFKNDFRSKIDELM